MNNFPNYGVAEGFDVHVADFSIALLGTGGGLYMAATIRMFDFDINDKGFKYPGVVALFDYNNNDKIDNDTDDYAFIDLPTIYSGTRTNGWRGTAFNFASGGDLVADFLMGVLYIEFRNPFTISNSTQQTFGVDFGLTAIDDITGDIFVRMFDSGLTLEIIDSVEDAYTSSGGPNFSSLVLEPSVKPVSTVITETVIQTVTNTPAPLTTIETITRTITDQDVKITESFTTTLIKTESAAFPIIPMIMGLILIVVRFRAKKKRTLID